MYQERLILQSLRTLPPTAQQQVLDFIAFLQTRYQPSAQPNNPPQITSLHDERFVGMWQDRADMQNSSAWVRTIRTQEWG
jgi:hypothetical protein